MEIDFINIENKAVNGIRELTLNYTILIIILISVFACTKRSEASQNPTLPETKFTEISGRLTASSITINYLFDQKTEFYCEYGTASGNYSGKTVQTTADQNQPLEVNLSNLSTNQGYFYRTRYRPAGSTASFSSGTEHTFHTQRPAGTTFTFAVEADPHLDSNSDTASYVLTLKNILGKLPDFMLDLGDTFFSEKQANVNQSIITSRHLLYRKYFGLTCHSVPLYFAVGNHEGENGWLLDGSPGSLPVMVANTRKMYYSNPLPDAFFSGNSKPENYVGLRGNYYSFEWGDALIVVLDPYWYTLSKPDWGWTLGIDQYNWFRNVITTSRAKYKFVFCHQLVGGNGTDGRGGAEYAGLFEMGGYNTNGTWGFDSYRPGWGKPIHTLMKENNVKIFFHGHDHFYGKQEKDGVIYQEVPQPSNKNLSSFSAASYGYTSGVLMPARGYMLITVSPSGVKVDLIGTYLPSEENSNRRNADVIASYTLN